MTSARVFRSAIYEGEVTHHRREPALRFAQTVAVPLLFTDELAELSHLHPLVHLDPAVPSRRQHAVRLNRADFLVPHNLSIEKAVSLRVEAAGGKVAGPVAVLAHVRTWGWLFNPLAVYYCFDPTGSRVEWAVLEVENTPWHERHCYVIGAPGRHHVPKAMHVSPFLPMEAFYDIEYSPPASRATVHIEVLAGQDSDRLFSARMHLRRRELDRRALDRLLWRFPAMTARVTAGIYGQAVRLAARGAAVHPHPRGVNVPSGPSDD